MADNVGITPGSGDKAASRSVNYSGESAQVQVVGLATFAGADDAKTVADVSEDAPLPVAAYGELIDAIEALRMTIHSLTRAAIGQVLPDAFGRLQVTAFQSTGGSLNATVSGTVTSNIGTGSLANVTQIGGIAAADHIPALLHLQGDNLRRNITVT